MKTNIMRIAPILVAVVICACGRDVRAQATTTTASSTDTATTVTTTKGAFTEFVPASETIVVRTETNPAPLRYVVTKQTTIVDEAGVPITIEKISPGSPLSVNYTGTGDRLVASRIVVHKAPVVTDRAATTTTTTTTTRPLTDEEKKAVKKEVEKQKEKADEAKDKAEDDED
jgi:hypothetical protein